MIGRVLALLFLLLLAACTRAPVRSVASDPESKPRSSQPGSVTPRPDQPGDYTPGGLYKPGVRDGGPAVPPDLSQLKEPVPREEPRSRYGNRSPYTVLGRSYRVMDSATGYVERGTASWYGEKFHGRATSSFEPYDMYAFSAAHRTLPLPTYARVTNLENGRSVVVRVNDRGPFHDGRLIDLSYAAAVRLGVWPRGTAQVEVRALSSGAVEPLPATQVASSTSTTSASGPTWLQVASFGDRDNADRLADRLRQAELGKVKIQHAKVNGGRMYRVRLGPFDRREIAERLISRVSALGFGRPTLVSK